MKKKIKYLYLDSMFWALFDALTIAFVVPFALVLGATNTIVGSITSLRNISIILSQYPGAKLAEVLKRKTIYVALNLISRFFWVFIAMIPFIFKESAIVALLVALFVYWLISTAAVPAWTSLAGDLVPEKKRGIIFGRRDMITTFVGISAALLGGIYLDQFPKNSLNGFLTMFLAAIVFGMLSLYFFNKIREPKQEHTHNHLLDIFKVDKELKRFYIFSVFFNFAYMMASPLFVVYILNNLGASYLFLMLVSALSAVSRIASQMHWGKLSDKIGDRNVILICTLGTAFVPLLFIFVTPETLWLIIIAQIYSGIVWAGFGLASFNLLLGLTRHEKRAMQIASFNTINSIPLIISPIVGGLIADKITFLLSGIPLVFAISFVLRMISPIFLKGIEEPRVKTKYPFKYAFREAVTFHPIKETIHAIRALKRIK